MEKFLRVYLWLCRHVLYFVASCISSNAFLRTSRCKRFELIQFFKAQATGCDVRFCVWPLWSQRFRCLGNSWWVGRGWVLLCLVPSDSLLPANLSTRKDHSRVCHTLNPFVMERVHSRDRLPYWSSRTVGTIWIKTEQKSHRIYLGHQYGRHFIVSGHQYGRPWRHVQTLYKAGCHIRARHEMFIVAHWDTEVVGKRYIKALNT